MLWLRWGKMIGSLKRLDRVEVLVNMGANAGYIEGKEMTDQEAAFFKPGTIKLRML